jgi:hypothetical protein
VGQPTSSVAFGFWPAAELLIRTLTEGGAMPGIGCPCGHHLEAADDDELFGLCRELVDREHPVMRRTDAQIRERVGGDAYHRRPVA